MDVSLVLEENLLEISGTEGWWYGDSAGDTVEENSSVFSLIRMHKSFSALTLLVGQQERHPACKNGGIMEVDTGWFGWSGTQPDG